MIEMVGEFSEIAEAESPLAKLAEDIDVPSSEELDDLIEKAESSGHMLDNRETDDTMPGDDGEGVASEDVDNVSEEGEENAMEDVGDEVFTDAGEGNPGLVDDDHVKGPEEDETDVMTESTSDCETNEGDEPRDMHTRNEGLAGSAHPETGVPFVTKIVETAEGEKVKGVFPEFESVFDAQLPEDLYHETDAKQFEEAQRQLKEKYDSDPEFRKQFSERAQYDIENGNIPPYGYTWHHNEETGKMQLVDYDTHQKTGHTGGKAIWGGGNENR